MKGEKRYQVPQNEPLVSEIELPQYEVPSITTYRDEEILEELGPAQTQYGGPGPNAQF